LLFHEAEETKSLRKVPINKNLLKSGNIVKSDEARVIDSNNRIAERLQYLAQVMEIEQDYSEDEYYSEDGFTEGLNAIQVEQLMSDPETGAEEVPEFDTKAFDEMREQAQIEAEGILSAAREEAEGILSNANAEAVDIKVTAHTSGHDEGYNEGYNEAMEIAQKAEADFNSRTEELERYYQQKISELEPLFVEKLTGIYEHIFNIDLSSRKDLIVYLLSDAIRNIDGTKTYLIHVSREDIGYVTEHKEELLTGIPDTSTIELIEDATLSSTECFIEAESGIFDCGLGTELSLLKKELSLLSYKSE